MNTVTISRESFVKLWNMAQYWNSDHKPEEKSFMDNWDGEMLFDRNGYEEALARWTEGQKAIHEGAAVLHERTMSHKLEESLADDAAMARLQAQLEKDEGHQRKVAHILRRDLPKPMDDLPSQHPFEEEER